MPLHLPPTMAEREAELAALQSAFDEYIASSRELEEELDAELAKMQEKLAESSAANAALSLQLENIAPQLTSLENSLGDCRKQLKEEQKLRRQAESAQDVAEAKVRELENELVGQRNECDAITEELAFKDAELEEAIMKMEIEKEQLREELEDLRADLIAHVQNKDSDGDGAGPGRDAPPSQGTPTRAPMASASNYQQEQEQNNYGNQEDEDDNEAYAKKLEDELELVTEQLIDAEKRSNEIQEQLHQAHATIQAMEMQRQNQMGDRRRGDGTDDEDNYDNNDINTSSSVNTEEIIRHLKQENADRLEDEQRMRREIEQLQEEVELAREEVRAAEDDSRNFNERIDEMRHLHREEITKLQRELDQYEMGHKSNQSEFQLIEKALQETLQTSAAESVAMKEEIDNLNKALKNAKGDYNALLEELETVSSRFDEACQGAERKGREAAYEELRKEQGKELVQLKEQLHKLESENKELQEKLEVTEVNLSTIHSTQDENIGNAQANNEVLQKLQTQLLNAKEDLNKKDKELSKLVKDLEERLDKAEQAVYKTEQELSTTKNKLAEADAKLIVLKREKERAEGTIPKQNKASGDQSGSDGDNATTSQQTDDGEFSESRDDISRLSSFDNYPRPSSRYIQQTPRKRRSRSSSPPSVTRLEYRLAEESTKFKTLSQEYEELKDQKRMGDARIKRLEEDLRVLQKEIFATSGNKPVVTGSTKLSNLATHESGMDVLTDNELGSNRLQDIIESHDTRLMAEELRSLSNKCNSQREYNAQLLSKMLHLQGNIQVYCRIRPMTVSEIQRGYKGVVEALSETEIGCFDSRTNKWKSFAFDRVWGPDQSQQSIFQDVEPVALSVVDGYNACIFAYGQTGSGKTFTMEGKHEGNQFGISYRTIQKVFHLLNLRAQQQKAAELIVGDTENEDEPLGESVSFTFSLSLSMLEIYNDGVYDLLSSDGGATTDGGKVSLDVRRDQEGRIEVPNLTKESVSSIEDVMNLLKRGNENRAVAATDLNEHSSRSHMVLLVNVVSGMNGLETNKGTLYLVDLAGSERVRKSNVAGEQLREAAHINKSLSALGNVMEALDRKAAHIPYRDSKLTYLLQDSLGGNSRTMMIVAVCPMDVTCDESVHALQFATRVRRIQIGAASRNVSSKNLEETVKSLTEELKSLSRSKERTEGQLNSLKRDNSRIQERLQNLSASRSQTKSDSRTLDVLRKNNTDMATRWQKEKRLREEAADELEKARKELRKVQQQLSKTKREHEVIIQEAQDKERKIADLTQELHKTKEASNAAGIRARRASVMNRNRKVQSTRDFGNPASSLNKIHTHTNNNTAPPSTSTGGGVAKTRPPTNNNSSIPSSDQTKSFSTSNAAVASAVSPDGGPAADGDKDLNASAFFDDHGDDLHHMMDGDQHFEGDSSAGIPEIREKVLSLLERYDKAKVNRIDIIMEKFKGKEHLLLQKMQQRYEGDETGPTPPTSVQKRNELAMERHKERMKLLREGKQS